MGWRKIDPVMGSELIDALHEQGLIPDGCVKVIIEIDATELVKIHYEVIGERGLLTVLPGSVRAVAIFTDPQGDPEPTP